MKKGRPTQYSKEVANKICEQLEQGLSLKQICEQADMPVRSTVYLWLREYSDFSDNYTRAREVHADLIHDELLELVDNIPEDFASIAKARLQADTRKWVLARMSPRKYGDTSKIELTGNEGGPVEISETVRLSRLNSLLAKAKKRGYREES
ncbi:hypothetical protein IX83_07125 [Basilea psittacipulmonis DSM 24701]|uniref:Terminase small subunit n=1 Tax=Basilea psittacipulmonis DSM 24701 TaxID=1072685 RepID=A0A077DG12_9BURK|nr:hypothetical protein IX83_07125 [Basilea psittacipulmonis DSM 24701]